MLYELRAAQGRQSLEALLHEPGTYPYLATLLAAPATLDIQEVDVRPSAISAEAKTLIVQSTSGKVIHYQLRNSDSPAPGMIGWVGDVATDRRQRFTSPSEMDFDPFNWVSIVREGDKVVGDIHIDGQLYRLDYIGNQRHVLVKVDEAKLSPEAEPLAALDSGIKDPSTGKQPQSAYSIIRMLLVSTKQSRAINPSYRLPFAQALQNANLYMRNSRVAITYQLAGFYDADYDETGRTYKQQLDDMRLAKPFGPDLLKVRDAVRADLVSMYSAGREYCGMAWLNTSKAQGHSVVSCFGSLAHELGHNLGAHHNWHDGDPVGRPPYMFGYRYITGSPRFSTQMSYGCNPACPLIPYHSNPDIEFETIPVGTREHHDVARRFNERREVVEDFYADGNNFTVYEHANYQGNACTFTSKGGVSAYLADMCGEGWQKKVSSLKVSKVKPGARVRILSDSGSGARYISLRLDGDLELPTLQGPVEIPGAELNWLGGSLDDKVYQVWSNER